MATVSCGRGALAMALVGAFASSAEATGWRQGIVVDRGSAVQMDPGDILRLSGDDAVGIRVAPRATFDAEAVSIVHEGAGRGPDHAYGILVFDGAEVSLSGSHIDIRGRRTVGIQAQRNAVLELQDTIVRLSAAGETGNTALALAGGRTVLRGSTIDAERGHAVSTRFSGSDTAYLQLQDTTIRGRIVSGDVGLDIAAVAGDIEGDIMREGGGALALRMQRGSWRGQGTKLTALSLEDATWKVTADSDVAAVSLDHGGRIAFDHAGTGFRTLRAGTWQADAAAGGVVFGARLDAGGNLRRQATDRLLIGGDAYGSTPVHVVNVGGGGAPTAGRDGINGSADGISLIQVAGGASAESFHLAGDYVAVGPWQYRLHAYEPGRSDPRQRLVDGKGGGFWDFRLQSASVEDPEQWRNGRAHSGGATRAALLPQVPAYLVLTHALFGYGGAALDALRAVDLDAARDPALRVRAFGGSVDYRSTLPFNSYGFDYTRHDRGLQVAGDLLIHALGDMTLRAGMAANLGNTRMTPHAVDGRSEARIDARGVALQATLLAADQWRVASTYAITHYRVDVRTPSRGEVLGRLRANAHETALAADYRWRSGEHLLIEPGASVTWQRLRYSRAADGDGVELLGGRPQRLSLRGGLRASLALEPRGSVLYAWTPYLDVRYAVTRGSGESLSLSGERFRTGRAGRSAEVSAGTSFDLWSRVTAHVAVSRRLHVGQGGESGFAARAGLAMTF